MIFKDRQRRKLQYEARIKDQNSRKRAYDDGKQAWSEELAQKGNQSAHNYHKLETPQNLRKSNLNAFLVPEVTSVKNNKSQADLLREQLNTEVVEPPKSACDTSNTGESLSINDSSNNGTNQPISDSNISKNNSKISNNSLNNSSILDKSTNKPVEDEIELHKDGWRSRYYLLKFDISENDLDYDNFRNNVVGHYVTGLSWVLQYYYQGCPSWSWFYPFHYAPFASDCSNILNVPIKFPKTTRPVIILKN